MKKIVIIGAGAMGSAFSIPCADNSNEVILVGSFLEDKIIDQINNNKNQHPVLNCQLPKNVKVIKFSEFDDKMRVTLERLMIRSLASLLDNNSGVESMEISDFILTNKRVDR